ncbi:MAG: methionyl-tRNA formyltransferase [Pirellula sp.]|jgi:methionyl-tRNA formyltransferase
MRLILMGTGPFAVPSFQGLRVQGHDVAAVVTRPEVPSANTKKPTPISPVRSWAESCSLTVTSPASINSVESIEWLRSLQADLLVVCDYGQILSSECLSVSRLGGINLHGSLLPRHRGAAPVQWSILSGDQNAGVSIIHMTPGLDAGPVIVQESTQIAPTENAFRLESRLSTLGTKATLHAVDLLQNWNPASTESIGLPQDKSQATKAPRLSKADGALVADSLLKYLDRQIRGLYPWPGCYGNLIFPNGQALRVIVHEASPLPIDTALLPASVRDAWDIGRLIYGEKAKQLQNHLDSQEDISLGLIAIDGLLLLKSLQPAGKKQMTADEFLRGYSRMEWIRLAPLLEPNSLLARMKLLETAT